MAADTAGAVPADLDFAFARALPRRWVNNGFEGWNGDCEIAWSDRRMRLKLNADRLFGRYFLFVSDPKFSAGYNFEFFAFEPMSHSATPTICPIAAVCAGWPPANP